LAYQGINLSEKITTDEGVVSFIERVGCIQYDPLRQTARNADLVLNNRIEKYREEQLFSLLYEKRYLFDGWDQNMSIISVNHWPYFARERELYRNRYLEHEEEFKIVKTEILKFLETEEFICSSDIKNKERVDWYWAPANIVRAVLESMYHSGELLVHHKQGTRKYYSLTSRLISQEILNSQDPNIDEDLYNNWQVKRRIDSIGFLWNRSGDGWLGCRLNKNERADSLKRLLDLGQIEELSIDGIDDVFYISTGNFSHFVNNKITARTSFLAPLDNLIWDRKVIQNLFGFSYKWEVYTPSKARKYGYYVLPVLYKNSFVARFEPVFDRKKNELVIKNWWWEDSCKVSSSIKKSIDNALKDFMLFLGAKNICFINNSEKTLNLL
ncbi:MAG: crosslink repair DNA glycosylase YcaQ family protein, partial [Spirochaetales bacterium]|nr:crosslink repair DNA glycosylase YcaQ family protein [Spirochaetales bacterium]